MHVWYSSSGASAALEERLCTYSSALVVRHNECGAGLAQTVPGGALSGQSCGHELPLYQQLAKSTASVQSIRASPTRTQWSPRSFLGRPSSSIVSPKYPNAFATMFSLSFLALMVAAVSAAPSLHARHEIKNVPSFNITAYEKFTPYAVGQPITLGLESSTSDANYFRLAVSATRCFSEFASHLFLADPCVVPA